MNENAEKKSQTLERATLGGGCFWCLEAVYQQIQGVHSVVSGYAGGRDPHPSYEAVCTGETGHAEIVDIQFDPTIISYRDLLEIFFVIHDPTTLNRQGHDTGTQYRSGVYVTRPAQAEVAQALIAELTQAHAFDRPIVTEVLPLDNYSAAEDDHQDFFERNPDQGYCLAVAAPKVAKFRKTFARLVRD